MNDAGDNYDRMPIERVDSILRQLRPEYWTPERLRGASPSEKREAVRKAFTGRGRHGRGGGKSARRRAADSVSRMVSAEDAPAKSDIMSDLPPAGLILGGETTNQLNARLTEGGGYDYGDLDPGIVADAKAAATLIRSLMAEIVNETVPREIRIGRELLKIKARLGHGHFGPWLAAEFGMSDRQARRYMSAAQGKVSDPGTRDEDVDAYMTDPSVGAHLVAVMKTKLAEEGIPADELWWLECCAGSGNILQHMPPDRRRGIDINPLAPDIRRADFLRYELDQTVSWLVLTNPPFSDDGPTRMFNRAAAQGVQAIGLVLPAHLRPDKAHWVNGLDPFYECIHDELLPKESFLRNGKPHDVPARFQISVRRDTRREPVVERTEHPDLPWVPRSQSNEATIWICRRGPDIGEIIEAIGITTPPEGYYGIRCSVEAVAILRSIRWRDVLDPLPIGHAPNMSQSDIVRAYIEATRRALPTQFATDILLDQPASSVIPSKSSPPHEEAQQFTKGDAQTDQYYNGSEPRYIHYDDPYHTIGGGVRICKSPQTARFISNVRVPLDFDLGAHLEAMFGPENDR
jgi:hypothetical protein